MRKVIFYFGITGILIGAMMVFAAYFMLRKPGFDNSTVYLLGYGFLIFAVSGLITFIAKIFINQRG